MIVDCHFHVDEKMLTLEKMVEGMDKNDVTKTVLIPPMNETMFELESAFQHNLQRLFRFLILNAPQIGLKIYDGCKGWLFETLWQFIQDLERKVGLIHFKFLITKRNIFLGKTF
jgi:hypothetical protein